MLVVLIARDKPGALEIRKSNREAHLAYLKDTGCVQQAGPIMEDGAMAGSILVLDLPDMAAAEAWAADDPYAKAGLFASVEMLEWNRVIG
ncbi:YciI-like protein [Roseivivax sp. THAF40]|uniref:YciI family protein n=1 Tax=unclassified Roseivivax TaxID=2639302 RepID=UPI001268C9A1|nr:MULTISPECIES: YciI family protein [unclassified Roseivivax]QFS84708.1 YciI-like protein [Roseivivax sp. THAF197b]QFT48535.1 YciI-like protein [Roseivivax sp. THAF40]